MKKHNVQPDFEAISYSRLTKFSLGIQLFLFKAHLRLISIFERVQARWLIWLQEEILSDGPLTPQKYDVTAIRDWSAKNQYIACASNFIERHLIQAGIVTKCKVYVFWELGINEELPHISINAFGTHRCDLITHQESYLRIIPFKTTRNYRNVWPQGFIVLDQHFLIPN